MKSMERASNPIKETSLNYLKEYKRFINSYYLTNGLKITLSLIFPALIGLFIGKLGLGLDFSLGALFVSVIDSPGPFQHRRNAMFIGILVIFFNSFISLVFSGSFLQYPFVLILGFLWSLISAYGTRATNIGLSGLLATVFSLNSHGSILDNLSYSFILFLGGAYYLVFSTLSYRILPLELARKALGDCIFKTGQYIQSRSRFYNWPYDQNKWVNESLKDQLEVLESQKKARELLLKNRALLKESNYRGRRMVLIFIEILDIYDELSATHADYKKMHEAFSQTGIMEEIRVFIDGFAESLEILGRAVSANILNPNPQSGLDILQEKFLGIQKDIRFYSTHLDHEANLEGVLSIRRVERSLGRALDRLKSMNLYLYQDKPGKIENLDINSFIDHEAFSFQILLANLKLPSVYFRHAIRVTIALGLGLSVLPFLAEHRGYWILLTIVAILKPGFSLSKTRTLERLSGTILGAGLAFFMIFLVHSDSILFGIMVFSVFLSYSLSTPNYLVSVFFTSIFVLLLFHFLYPTTLNYVPDRIIDTAIGFIISLGCIYLVFPTWEFSGVPVLIIKCLEANKLYFESINHLSPSSHFDLNAYKLARKEIYLRISNLNSALERMSKEPSRKQVHLGDFHKLAVLNTQFASSIAAIGAYWSKNPFTQYFIHLQALGRLTHLNLEKGIHLLKEEERKNPEYKIESPLENIEFDPGNRNKNLLKELTHARFEEIREGILESETQIHLREFSLLKEQFEYLAKLSSDILMECQKLPTN